MENLIRKTAMAGLGLVSYSREKVEKMAEELVEKGELSQSEESEFVKKMMDRAEKDKQELEKKVGEVVENTMERMNVPTRKELEELKEEIRSMKGEKSGTKGKKKEK